MSEAYEAVMEIREPLAELRDAAVRIAEALERMEAPAEQSAQLARLDGILLDLYPDSCARHGLAAPHFSAMCGKDSCECP